MGPSSREKTAFITHSGLYEFNVMPPLHALTRESVPFFWSMACQSAFQKLKDLLTIPPVLAYPDFDKPFVMHTDASINGLGAVLEQEQVDGKSHPIAYASRSLFV